MQEPDIELRVKAPKASLLCGFRSKQERNPRQFQKRRNDVVFGNAERSVAASRAAPSAVQRDRLCESVNKVKIAMELYAHKGQSLAAHLKGVAERAKVFASFFDSADQGYLAGLLHDLGKAEQKFQDRILGKNGKDVKKEPHAHHGAALLLQGDPKRHGPVWPVAFAINAHHAGLHDRPDLQKRITWRDKAIAAEERLAGDADWNGTEWPVRDFGKNLPDWLENLRFSTPEQRAVKLRAVDLYTRFLFSALIDADRLDTEENDHETKGNVERRDTWRFGRDGLAANGAPEKLLDLLDKAIQSRRNKAIVEGASAAVLKVREEVLEACGVAAMKLRGIFTLTVPTGGGKTVASVWFALKHIAAQNREPNLHHKLRRIIVVIPYLNIIQQTANVLKDAFRHQDEDPVVLEHHSQAQDPPTPSDKQDGKRDTDDYSRERTLRQLAAENWDAPIVVTTSVQFFDSLFSRRPADARKLHNIAQSVLIFDEVQTLPPRLMQPVLDVLGELTNPQRHYGCSLVLCTATQPALNYDAEDLRCGLSNRREGGSGKWEQEALWEIIAEPAKHFQILKRVDYQWLDKPVSWDALAGEVASHKQALVIVNTRRHARDLFDAVRKKIVGEQSKERPDRLFHLSTWMTPAHRMAVLDQIRERLDAKRPCLLISTQCVEAGVDVDFPAVWRAFGPYDAIAQAAGRCNRNGALRDVCAGQPVKGLVRIFRPADAGLPGDGVYKIATKQTDLLRRMQKADPHDPGSFETYFHLLYQLTVPDECEIQRHRGELHFEEVSNLFRLVDSFAAPLLIAQQHTPGDSGDTPIRTKVNGHETELAEFVKLAQQRDRGYFTPSQWHLLQPHIVNLDIRSKETLGFLKGNAKLIFHDDDPLRGLYVLNASLYEGGPNGCGLDVLHQDLSHLTIM